MKSLHKQTLRGVIVHRVNFINKLFGLMFQREVNPIYFETRFGIHTFFVQRPIDVLVLDKYFKVKVVREKLQPWRIFLWNPKYFRVLEFPSGFIKKNNINLADKLSLVFK